MADPEFRPAPIIGDRSIREVLKRFGMAAKLKCLFFQSKENNLTGGARFPLSSSGEARPFILTRKLGRRRTAELKDFARVKGATLNDVVLTAYYRCLFQRLALSPGSEIQIPVMVDMRRYLKKGGEFVSLTNLASTVITQLAYWPEERFEATLVRVRWLRKFGQRDEWRVVPLTAINMAETRSNDDATSAPESYSSVQSEGGPSRTKRG